MKDELLEQAKEWSRKQGFVSVSYLQRIMRIGYTRAARLVDYMIEDSFCQNEYMAGTGHRQIIEAVAHTLAGGLAVCTCQLFFDDGRSDPAVCEFCGKPQAAKA